MKLHKWTDIERTYFTPEEIVANKARALAELAIEMNLPELRNALGKTQTEVAAAAKMSQGGLSDFERRDDHMLSALRRYAAALGGEIEVAFRVGGQRVLLKGV